MKINPVGKELFYVERWTDMTRLIATFRTSAKEPKNNSNKN